jgi:hypothetical protein
VLVQAGGPAIEQLQSLKTIYEVSVVQCITVHKIYYIIDSGMDLVTKLDKYE